MRKHSQKKRWEPDGATLIGVLSIFADVKIEELKLSNAEVTRYLKELARRKLLWKLSDGSYRLSITGETVLEALSGLEFRFAPSVPTADDRYMSGLLTQADTFIKQGSRAMMRKRKSA